MGGHGGLNILPQKSWHVYNQDNREKVARDEAKQAAKEQEAQRKHEQAEREHRHELLLSRAGLPIPSRQAAAFGPAAAASGSELAFTVSREEGQLTMLATQPLQHINFWKEDEDRTQHPETLKEQKDEVRRRGNPETITSDARFDERFQFGHNMQDKPWYARVPTPTAPSSLAVAAAAIGAASHHTSAIGNASVRLLLPGTHASAQIVGMVSEQRHTAPDRSRARKRSRPHQPSSSSSSSSGSDSSSSSSGSSSDSSSSDSASSTDGSSSPSTSTEGRQQQQTRHSHSSSRSRSRTGSKRRRSGSPHPTTGSSEHRFSGKRQRQQAEDNDQFVTQSDRRASDKPCRTHGSSKKHHSRSTHQNNNNKSDSKHSRHRSKRTCSSRHPGSKNSSWHKAVEVSGGPGSKSLQQLRAERLQREQAESEKARQVVVAASGFPAGSTKAYNSAFGHAARLTRTRQQ